MEQTILYEKDGHLATITLNRPKVLNAVDARMSEALDAAIAQAQGDDDVWVVIVAGEGKSFCTGQDLRSMANQETEPRRAAQHGVKRRGHVGWSSYQLYSLDKPTIAAVQGHAFGGGLSLALACDIRIAAEDASFCAVFARRGLAPDSGSSFFLPRTVGYAMACELAFTTRPMAAQEALSTGLVNRVVPNDALEGTARAMAAEILEQAPLAVRMAKRGLRRGFDREVLEAYEYELYVNGIAARTDDVLEGGRAFVEKRPPVWRGL